MKTLFITFLILFSLTGCFFDENPQNSDVNIINSTDKPINVVYFTEELEFRFKTSKRHEKQVAVNNNERISIQESFWTVEFTIEYSGVEYHRSINVNFWGGKEDYNVTLKNLGVNNG